MVVLYSIQYNHVHDFLLKARHSIHLPRFPYGDRYFGDLKPFLLILALDMLNVRRISILPAYS